jgi:hypothetical protein
MQPVRAAEDDMHPRAAVGPAGLDEDHSVAAAGTEAACEDGASRAGPEDHVIGLETRRTGLGLVASSSPRYGHRRPSCG